MTNPTQHRRAFLWSAAVALMATIDGTDGIVYVDEGKCSHSVRACLVLSVRVAGPHRILRILVDTNRDRDGLMGAIGHELRHAIARQNSEFAIGTTMCGRSEISASTPHVRSRRASCSVSTVQTCTPSPASCAAAMNRAETTRVRPAHSGT